MVWVHLESPRGTWWHDQHLVRVAHDADEAETEVERRPETRCRTHAGPGCRG